MSIQIVRGPRGDGSPIISFVGQDSDDQQAADTFSFVQTITPQVNPLDSNSVDIVDTILTLINGNPTYLLANVDYVDWLDRDGNSFASALDVVTYIQNQTSGSITILEERTNTPVAIGTSVGVSAGVQFEFDGTHEGGCGYFWDTNGFPSTMEVSRFDRRKISGTINTPGTYGINYSVANVNGITTSTVTIYVL